MYYSPYCGLCGAISYVYLTVAYYLSHMDHLIFVKVDGDNNDLPWEYSMNRFPSILFFPAKRYDEFLSLSLFFIFFLYQTFCVQLYNSHEQNFQSFANFNLEICIFIFRFIYIYVYTKKLRIICKIPGKRTVLCSHFLFLLLFQTC